MHTTWLNNLKISWEQKDFDFLSSVLADSLEWYESPFTEPLISKEAIVEQWKKDLANQSDIHFDYKILVDNEKCCVANWNASFIKDSKDSKMDGIFYFELSSEGKCKIFKQWWVVKPK